MTPNTTPTTSAAARPNSTTRTSNAGVTAAGNSPGGISAGAALRIAAPTPMPSVPPRTASTRLSVSSCLMMRPRAAPSADRTAISRVRAVARASSRLATFAQHRSSTKPTTPSRNIDVVCQIPPDDAGADRLDDHAGALVRFGICVREPVGNDVQLGLRRLDRHTRLQPRDDLEGARGAYVGMSGNWPDSVQISAGRENCTLSATTPTTVYGWPFKRTRRPTIEASLLNGVAPRLRRAAPCAATGHRLRA